MKNAATGAVLKLRIGRALYLAWWLASGLIAFEPRAHATGTDVEVPPDASDSERSREPPIQVYGGPRALVVGRSGGDSPQALSTGLGFQVGAAQFWQYVGMGAELRFAWLEAFEREPSMRSLEVLLKPALGYAFEHLPLRLYAAVPFGLSLTLPPRAGAFAGPISADGVLGPALGATTFVAQRLGLNVEAGYQWTGPRNEPLVRRELTLALNIVYGL